MTSWQTKKLGDIANIKRGGSPRPIQDYLISNEDDGYSWLKIGDVPAGSRYIFTTSAKIKPEGLKKTTLVKKGGFILSNSMSFGRPYIMMTEACIHDGWLALQDIDNTIDKQFLYYLLTSEQMQNKFKNYSAGSGVQNLKKETVQDIDFEAPEKPEQQRIVGVLEVWDEYIEKLEQKIALKERLKKGLMQQLLTGKRRLRGFGNEWDVITLGDVGKVSMCKRIFSEQTSKIGEVPFYKISTFGKKPDAFISQELYDEYRHNYSFPNKGDVLISASGTIGRTVVYDGKPAYFQDSNIIWIANDENVVLNRFLYYLYKYVKWDTASGTIARLYNDNVRRVKIPKPSINEQARIADILQTCDKDIRTLKLLLRSLLKQKQYLLKNLITGTIRVPETLEVTK